MFHVELKSIHSLISPLVYGKSAFISIMKSSVLFSLLTKNEKRVIEEWLKKKDIKD
jgi:hypothetical protein